MGQVSSEFGIASGPFEMVANTAFDPGPRFPMLSQFGQERGVIGLQRFQVQRRRDFDLTLEMVIKAPDARA
jgi:hypothetical protein